MAKKLTYWAISNIFKEFEENVVEELLFCGEYGPQYYKARRKYGEQKRGKWTRNWLPLKFANMRIHAISTVLVKDNEKTIEEIKKIERDE